MKVVLLIGGRDYPLPEDSAKLLRDLIREFGGHERPLSYLTAGESPEPIELGTRQIEPLADLLWNSGDESLGRLRDRLRAVPASGLAAPLLVRPGVEDQVDGEDCQPAGRPPT
jgi:hypothetical protein